MKKLIFLFISIFLLGGCIHPPISVESYSHSANRPEQLVAELKQNFQKHPIPHSIGVLPFKESGKEVGLGLAATEFITSNLSLFENLTLIDQSYADVLENEFATYSPSEKRMMLRAEQLVGGQLKVSDGKLQVKADFLPGYLDSPRELARLEGRSTDFFRLVGDISIKILEKNKITVTPQIAEQIYKPPTEDLVAYVLYAKGRRMERLGDARGAAAAYRAALKRDPKLKPAKQQLENIQMQETGMVESASVKPDPLRNEDPIAQPPNTIEETSVPGLVGNSPVIIEFPLPQ